MTAPSLPPALKENKSDETEVFELVNALRKVVIARRVYTVGGASGEITIGAANNLAIEFFLDDGTSLGVLAFSAFTVNP